ncbi:hypothetical protein MHD_10295 [Mannheimia granulomatis]|uniref:Uncharacterized protein n=1 Tax=Mannheimia granulomatis TaxID=85402 RepID=A0A011MIU2_9PAST|nr:hypothetical protein [Mannheimia granulomatis]EXI62391.1 hypothetical protein AK33_05760 [Mannheimia granulomatis]QIM66330.1 hypothetical protein A4G16_02555 [Mannheimia granulomatis]RGE47411.1 hypothetical protein MHD_10295 [Mannheimia granulomatis]
MLKFFDTVFLIVGAIVLAFIAIGFVMYGLVTFPKMAGMFMVGIGIMMSLFYLVKLTKKSAQTNQEPPRLLQAKNLTLRKIQNKIWDSFRKEAQ